MSCLKHIVYLHFNRHSTVIINISDLIISNENGIFIDNLLDESGAGGHECGSRYIKRFLNLTPKRYASVLFFLNRHIMEGKYIGQIIIPDDELLIEDFYLQVTSTVFAAQRHYASAISLENDAAVIYDDLKPQSTVSYKYIFLLNNISS